ncbi:MAG TPA: class II SORL domain-containing protein [Geobacteraceae bacterium]|nr:class II SORL domain-containing protein [Geobacteraceae bacterium]
MDRRTFIKTAFIGTAASTLTAQIVAAERYFPAKVDMSLFEGINRIKNPAAKTSLEKGHAPVITAPASVKGSEPFSVEVAVGENLHPMGPAHWIEYIELRIGNEPAGRVELQSRGYLKPKAVFTVVIPKEAAVDGKLTLVAQQHCNLHGLWESGFDIKVL